MNVLDKVFNISFFLPWRFKVCTYIDSIDQVLGLIYGAFSKDIVSLDGDNDNFEGGQKR